MGTKNDRVSFDIEDEPAKMQELKEGKKAREVAMTSGTDEKLQLLERLSRLYKGVVIKKEMDSFLICAKKENREELQNLAEDLKNGFQIGQILTRSGDVRNKKVISPEYGEFALPVTPYDLEKLTEQGVKKLEQSRPKFAARDGESNPSWTETTYLPQPQKRAEKPAPAIPAELEKLKSYFPEIVAIVPSPEAERFLIVMPKNKKAQMMDLTYDLYQDFDIRDENGRSKLPITLDNIHVIHIDKNDLQKLNKAGFAKLEKDRASRNVIHTSENSGRYDKPVRVEIEIKRDAVLIPNELKKLLSYFKDARVLPDGNSGQFLVEMPKNKRSELEKMAQEIMKCFAIKNSNGETKDIHEFPDGFSIILKPENIKLLNDEGFRKLEHGIKIKALERVVSYFKDAKVLPDGNSGQFLVEMPKNKRSELEKMAQEIMECFGIKNSYGKMKDIREFRDGFLIILKPENIKLLNDEGFKRLEQEREKGATRGSESTSSWTQTVNHSRGSTSGRER